VYWETTLDRGFTTTQNYLKCMWSTIYIRYSRRIIILWNTCL